MGANSGQMLSHYRLVEKIGEGGMGVVWKAEDTVLNRTVAIKVLPADLALDEERRRMFLDEARLAASVSHGNIVQVHALGRESDVDFIVMEYVEGNPLGKFLNGRPLSPDKLAEWGLQIAQGLARAHRNGLIHRDLKPANILITSEGDAKIVDFGLATLFSKPHSTAGSWASTLTEAKGGTAPAIAGTLPYMSPEQVRGDKLDARSDIFSFGTVLYEMTTGQRPFTGVTPADIAQEILASRPKPVHELVPKVPLDLHRIIEKTLSRDPGDRYQGMDDMAVDLRRLVRELKSGSSPSYDNLQHVARTDRGRRVGLGVVAAFAVLVGVLLLGPRIREVLRRAPGTGKPKVAVLFFENLGPSKDDDYLADAFTEDVITSLARIDGLDVLSRSAVQRYRGKDVDPKQIGQDLKVRYVLEGSIRNVDRRLRVTAQLIETTRGSHAWAEQFDGSVADLLAIQDTIAVKISKAVGIALPAEQIPLVANRWTKNAEAYAYFLTGREKQLNLKSPQRAADARPWLEKALKLDHDYAPALAVLAGLYAQERRYDARDSPGRLEKAHDLADRALELDSTLALAWVSHGWAFREAGRLEEARSAYERAIGVNPRLGISYHFLGNVHASLGEPERAIEIAERGIEIDPSYPNMHDDLANHYERIGDVRGAERVLAEGMQRFPENSELPRRMARLLRDQGNRREATELLRKTLVEYPDDFWAYVDLGNLLRDMDQTAESDSIFRSTMEQWPNVPRVLDFAGWHFMTRGDHAKARGLFAEAVRLDPYCFFAWRNLGELAVLEGRFEEAEKIHRQRAERWPDDPEPTEDLARVYERQGRYDDAERVFRERAERWPKKLGVLIDAAQFYNRRNRHDVAERWARNAMDVNPRSAQPYNQLGWESWHQGKYELAQQSFEKAIALDPHWLDSYDGLCRVFDYTARRDSAVVVRERYLVRRPGDARGWVSLGYAFSRLGKMHRAAAAHERALELDPKNADAVNDLGFIYSKMARYEKAIEMYERATTFDTTNAIPRLNVAEVAFYFLGDDTLAHRAALEGSQVSRKGTWQSAWASGLLAQIAKRRGEQVESSRYLATARSEIEKALRDAPRNLNVLTKAALIYGQSGNLEKARSYAERVLKTQRDSPNICYDLACAMALAGDADRALEFLKLAVAAGYTDKQGLQHPQLAAIREDPRFEEILSSIR